MLIRPARAARNPAIFRALGWLLCQASSLHAAAAFPADILTSWAFSGSAQVRGAGVTGRQGR